MIIYYRHIAGLILFIILFATPAYADVGAPMIIVAFPGMILSLVPIILIEAWYIHRSLNISFKRAAKVMGIANLESTLIGIPITWIICVIAGFVFIPVSYLITDSFGISIPDSFRFVIVSPAWLGPGDEHLYWTIPAASLVLLVPFCYVSWLVERRRAKRLLHECVPKSVNRATLIANIYSYAMLGLFVIGWLIVSLSTNKTPNHALQ